MRTNEKKLNMDPVAHPDRMVEYWKKEWKVVLIVVISGLLFDGCMSFGPILQGRLVDAIVNKSSLNQVVRQAAVYIAVILMIQTMRACKRFYVREFANRTSARMRRTLYDRILAMDLNALTRESTGDLMNKAVADVDICVEGMRKVTTEIFDTGVLMSAYLISMLVYDVKITIIACLFVPVAMWLAQRLKKMIVKYTKAARSQSSRVAEQTLESISHTALYRIHGLEEANLQRYEQELNDLEWKSVKSDVMENSMQPVYNTISMLGIAGIFYLGGNKVINGGWTIGMFSAYLVIFSALSVKASKAAKLFNSYQKAVVSWERIKPYFTQNAQDRDCHSQEEQDGWKGENLELTVSHLNFHYPDSETRILQDIQFQAKTGDLVGITGEIACGKSTLGLAMTGEYPYEGHICLGHQGWSLEVGQLSYEQHEHVISYMGHQPQLLAESIYENITLGKEGDITQVLRDVCFEQDLEQMPEGIQTMVGSGGVRLSGGQQARIALARALWQGGTVLILDDPFSAVDMKTERAIIENLRAHYRDRLILLISHRLAIFPVTDQVVLMHADGTCEMGTHENLAKSSREYQNLLALQNGGKS